MNDSISRQVTIDAIQGISRLATLPDNDAVVRMSAVEYVLFNLPPAQQWIPCSERLPEEGKMKYWVCTDTGYQCQCRWTNDVYGLGASDRWEWKIFDIPQYQKVVAWMPLPEPWKGEENGRNTGI